MTFELYQTAGKGKRGWRWRCKAANGKIVAASSESFSSKAAARINAGRTLDYLIEAKARGRI
jgi:uncharacterized protein YegP (UPF0339 family)